MYSYLYGNESSKSLEHSPSWQVASSKATQESLYIFSDFDFLLWFPNVWDASHFRGIYFLSLGHGFPLYSGDVMSKMTGFWATNIWNNGGYAHLYCMSGGCSSRTRVTQYGRILPFLVSLCHEEQDMTVSCNGWSQESLPCFLQRVASHSSPASPVLSLRGSFSLHFETNFRKMPCDDPAMWRRFQKAARHGLDGSVTQYKLRRKLLC